MAAGTLERLCSRLEVWYGHTGNAPEILIDPCATSVSSKPENKQHALISEPRQGQRGNLLVACVAGPGIIPIGTRSIYEAGPLRPVNLQCKFCSQGSRQPRSACTTQSCGLRILSFQRVGCVSLVPGVSLHHGLALRRLGWDSPWANSFSFMGLDDLAQVPNLAFLTREECCVELGAIALKEAALHCWRCSTPVEVS